MNVKKVGEFIKQKRKEKKLTQKELAEKLSITDRAISKWERGICCPDISILKELSSILEVSVNELLAGEEIEKLEKEKTDEVLIGTVNKYTSIEKRKRLGLWLLTIAVVIINLIFIFIMFLMYNQINGTGGITINSIQNKYFTDKFLTLTENKDYDGLANIVNDYYYRNACSISEDKYDYICMLKELNELGVEVTSHKHLNSYYNNLDDVSIYELILKYDNKEEIIKISISSNRKSLTEIYIENFRVSSNITCNDLYNPFSMCYNEKEQKNYYVWEMNLDSEKFFPEEINEKIINLFMPSNYNYTCD